MKKIKNKPFSAPHLKIKKADIHASNRRKPGMIKWRKLKYFFYKCWRFVTYDIWRITAQDASGIYRWLISVVKALILSVRFFVSDRMMEKASALTYNTLLALVPLIALMLGIGRGFGLQDVLNDTLQNIFPGQKEAIEYCFEFANNYLAHSKTGVVMGLGVVLLLWVIISLIGNIESVFNQIWQQKKSRSTVRKFTDYLSIIIVVPLIVFLSSGIQIFLQTFLKTDYVDATISQAMQNALKIAPYVLTILVFTAVYIIIPNTKVRIINALVAGAIAGCGFQVFQTLYISGQIWVAKYNAIYGSFAALPLLLLWVQMSWVICLYGAELAYASQNIKNFDFEKDTQNLSRRYFDFLTVVVAGIIYNRFKQGEEGLTTEELTDYLHLPSKLTNKITARLDEIDVIRETVDRGNRDRHYWSPGISPDTLTIGMLIERIGNQGSEDLKINYKKAFDNEWQTLRCLDEQIIHEADHLVSDIVLPKEIR